MSPIKRSLIDRYGEDALISPKRLRGGGGGDDDVEDHPEAVAPFDDEDLFDDELVAPSSTHGQLSSTNADEEEEYIPPEVLEEVKKKIPVKDQQRWKRPDLPENYNNENDMNFQWIDMDVTTSNEPLKRNPNSARNDVLGNTTGGPVPVLRCYGVNENGHSVATYIHGFTPYAYFAIPSTQQNEQIKILSDSELGAIRTAIDSRLREMSSRLIPSSSTQDTTPTALVLGVTQITDHKSIFGYETPHNNFLQIHVTLPTLVPALKRLMEDGITLSPISNHSESYSPFECNVPFVLRFMVDRNISGAGWLTLPASTYTIRSNDQKETHCQVRFVIHFILNKVCYFYPFSPEVLYSSQCK